MKIVVTIPTSFNGYDMFREEMITVLNLYKIDFNSCVELVVAKFTGSKYVFKLDYITKLAKEFNWKIKHFEVKSINNLKKNLDSMIKYAIIDNDSLIIDFYENFSYLKYKITLFKKYSKYINIFLIAYFNNNEELKCCNQIISLINSDNIFDYFYCEICQLKIILPIFLTDEFISYTENWEIYKRINYYKGEYA